MSPEQIEHFANGGQRLALAVRGLTPPDMATPSGPGTWSVQQLVIHLADGEATFADRARRVIATDNPPLLAWNYDAFAANLFYADQSAEDGVALVDLTRRQLARILRRLPAAAFARTGTHDQRGPQTLTDVITQAEQHLEHHLTFVAAKRERMGKLMW